MNRFIKENIGSVSKVIARKLKVSPKIVETVLLLGIPILLNSVSKKRRSKSRRKKRKS
jgi:hypothetical protein